MLLVVDPARARASPGEAAAEVLTPRDDGVSEHRISGAKAARPGLMLALDVARPATDDCKPPQVLPPIKAKFSARLTRRHLPGLLAAGIGVGFLAGCGASEKWHSIDISGSLPPLSFTMTRSEDGKTVTQTDYRGKIVFLYFGYTNCPDVCPTTLANINDVLTRLGSAARDVRVLFVTVDPDRDTAPILAAYVKNFGAEVVGLRGTPDQLTALARRYRVFYSVTPATDGHPYEVAHSSASYVFDRSGAARLIIASLSSTTPDLPGTAADLRRLVAEAYPSGVRAWLRQLV